jgi:hypothetical protein
MATVMTAELLIIIINYRNKVLTIQSLLTSIGFNKNKILIIEGKGRVILTENLLENLVKYDLKQTCRFTISQEKQF